MKRIKDVIDEIVELHDAFKFKIKKDDAEVVRNYIFGIPPEDDKFEYYSSWEGKQFD